MSHALYLYEAFICMSKNEPDRYQSSTENGGLYAILDASHIDIYIYLFLYRVSPAESTRLRENVPQVKIHQCNQKHLYPKLNDYGDKGERKVWSSCGSTYCTWFAWRITRTLRMSALVYSRLKRVHAATAHVKCLEP